MQLEQVGQVSGGSVTPIKAVSGRKDSDGQEQIIETGEVKKRVAELEVLYRKSQQARVSFNEAVKATAEKSGLLSAVVRKYVKARIDQKTQEESRKMEQLSLLFLDVGM